MVSTCAVVPFSCRFQAQEPLGRDRPLRAQPGAGAEGTLQEDHANSE